MSEKLLKIKEKSYETFSFWEGGAYGWAPTAVSTKLDAARIDWLKDLTDCLDIWCDKSLFMTNGELLLGYANLGSLVEGWMKLFYCVYYLDYIRNPRSDRNGNMIEPNDVSFEGLKQYSRGKIWDQGSDFDMWVDKIQRRRNAIHAFNNREIGSPIDFLTDIDKFYDFICEVDLRLPYP